MLCLINQLKSCEVVSIRQYVCGLSNRYIIMLICDNVFVLII